MFESVRVGISRLLRRLLQSGALLQGVEELDDVVLFLLRDRFSDGGGDSGDASAVALPTDARDEVAFTPREGEVLRALNDIVVLFSFERGSRVGDV